MLSEIELMPELGQTYLSAEGNAKAMDILVKIGDRTYNVEITKYYDSFKEALLALSTEIIGIIQKTTLKKNVTLDEIYSGYFGFKVRYEQYRCKLIPVLLLKMVLYGFWLSVLEG
ncbi:MULTISPECIES: hypothetical protein [unclassified Mucilaginibacter]|uniref:hypothetical protein n=1 Tax=unclassified Mucilaginibacter TaxID=2617802 RepID=UPI002AC946CE|nr:MULTISPECIES: hypothetical protein [unclassified Mucilaginibacter]MEB0261953.1 hypothetical protein [Mucilaginibacter sp. 10I4]MEB0277253.1 hypothetical protein [Mucilaginibacter sp. 10B2]MEB0300883.1 hypothetical protein [Mucilaginibacter sp. 5C4]WPX25380.1 hypothetical protein RHM67_08900 [Mucilaginibacter sp. 5C4]